jgi:hypothetical protein
MDKNYFMSRLANGESMDTIGAEIAAMMNEAVAEHTAKLEAEKAMKAAAEAEKNQAKRALIEELVEIVQELAILEGMDPGDMEIDDESVDLIVAEFDRMFTAMRELKKFAAALEGVRVQDIPAPKARIMPVTHKSDDQILAEFAKMFS